jgi:hypothetical protein
MTAQVGTLTKDIVLVTKTMQDMLKADYTVGLREVWYGDIDRVPVVPSAAIDPGTTDYTIKGTGYYVEVILNLQILVFYAAIDSSPTVNEDGDKFAEQLIDVIHREPLKNLGGLVIHGHIIRKEPGIATRRGAKFRGSRLTWRGVSRARL